jgi:hypothetical protein
MFACDTRYLEGAGFLASSGSKSLSIRWIEQTLIIASLDSVDHS